MAFDNNNKPPFGRKPFRQPPKGPYGNKPLANPPRSNKKVEGAQPAAGTERTDWGDVAGWYDALVGDDGSEYHKHVVLPGVVRLLDVSAGQQILDVACGQGVLCRILQGLGANVTGIDAAGPLIDRARERTKEGVRYFTGDAREVGDHPGIAPGTFDSATCVLAIQNIHPLPTMLRGIAKALKPGGRLVIAMMHPCFRVPKQSHWGWDEKARVQYRRVDKYLLPLKERIVTNPGIDQDLATWAFHRPLQTYVESLRNEGLLIDGMEEWASHKTSDSGPRAAAENVAREEIPMFMAIRAVKR
jgi:2-polyprenyl-3-methyl-5-hydroxy-6-metoxy-1,4-benzoquinol methylase